MKELKNLAFVEKYRPDTVSNVISIHTETIQKYLENPAGLPNLLFYSKIGGTGKSSLARAIINDLGCDVLSINASADRSIENIRTKVRDFARGQSTNGIRKCVFMDEGEKLSKDSMDALKNMIEEFSANTFYIFTTNNIEKINQPMQSRFLCLEFSRPGKNEIFKHIKNVCGLEGIENSDEGVNTLIDMYYPSIRNMLNKLQELKTTGLSVEKPNLKKDTEIYEKLWSLICAKKYSEVKKDLIENAVNVEEFNRYIFDLCITDNIDTKKQLKVLQTLSKNELAFGTTADKQIVFLASVVELIMIMKDEAKPSN